MRIQQKSASACFYRLFPHVPYRYTFALEKLSLHSLRTRRHRLDVLFLFRPTVALNPALPSWKMSVFVSLFAMFGTSQRLAFVPQINTVLVLGAPMQPTWWVKILTYLQAERFLFIIFYNLNLLLLLLLLLYIVLVLSTVFVVCVRADSVKGLWLLSQHVNK
jgi:hypothetical protein